MVKYGQIQLMGWSWSLDEDLCKLVIWTYK